MLDVMCGKLATYLRLCGYDAAYALDRGVEADDRLLDLAADEGRTLVTRDRELAARADAA
ncbi:Mut7-C RNAse domain-containing protein, partial [Halorubrum sp. SP9]|uniref:Mut7-C RNAse domain-containing protein n=1 Tax=Halorubrum sp. SP9 TaxID=1537267 RepID=UPI0037437E52